MNQAFRVGDNRMIPVRRGAFQEGDVLVRVSHCHDLKNFAAPLLGHRSPRVPEPDRWRPV